MTFSKPEEMRKMVADDAVDLYNPKTGRYVFVYNDLGSIAEYFLSKREAIAIADKSLKTRGEYWSSFLGPGGRIYDSDEWFTVQGKKPYGVYTAEHYFTDHYSDEGWIKCKDFALEHLIFENDEKAKEWGTEHFSSKYDYAWCTVAGKRTMLCDTCLVYEDELWNACRDAFKILAGFLPEFDDKEFENGVDGTDAASELRDLAIEWFEETYDVRILECYTEF